MTAQPAGKLITVAGIDGAGKSTLAAALHGALKGAGHYAVLIGKHTTEVPADAALSAYLDSLNAIVYRRDQAVGAACGDHYWLFALAAWYSLQDRLVIRPRSRPEPTSSSTTPTTRSPPATRPTRAFPQVSPRRSSPTRRLPTSSCSSRSPQRRP